jgi:hypothetical protein
MGEDKEGDHRRMPSMAARRAAGREAMGMGIGKDRRIFSHQRR